MTRVRRSYPKMLEDKATLLRDSNQIMILTPTGRFFYYAKRFVEEVLGEPERSTQTCWYYPNDKQVVFVVDEEYATRAWRGAVTHFSGRHCDALLGVKRPEGHVSRET